MQSLKNVKITIGILDSAESVPKQLITTLDSKNVYLKTQVLLWIFYYAPSLKIDRFIPLIK